MKTLVIMPTYNERASLETTVLAVLEQAPTVDILVVDDGSPDGTGLIADGLAKQNGRVHVLHRSEKAGLGAAYLAGFSWGFDKGYETLVEMDADGSHRPEDLPKLLAHANEADLVIGSRWVDGGAVLNWPWYRRAISKGGTRYADFMLGSKIKDMTAGFRAFDAVFLKSLDLAGVASRGYAFQVEMAWRTQRAGGRVIEVPIVFVERVEGVSKMTTAIVLEALWLVTKWGLSRLL
jgi:dolichol-phosphate mannosyltransferase